MEEIFNIAAGVFAYIASALWLRSATVKVKYDSTPGKGGVNGVALIDDQNNDILRSAAIGNRWSKWAALTASVAAAFQSAAMFVK